MDADRLAETQGIREQARRLAHANSLFQGGHGGRDDNEAVWSYAEDVYAEKCAEVERLQAAKIGLRRFVAAVKAGNTGRTA